MSKYQKIRILIMTDFCRIHITSSRNCTHTHKHTHAKKPARYYIDTMKMSFSSLLPSILLQNVIINDNILNEGKGTDKIFILFGIKTKY